jgi:general secretion pathway protein G
MTGINRNSIRSASRKGFTLVEILIVVIILGILAAIVIPQFTNASTDARKSNMASQDQTIKSQISLYMLQHNDTPPPGATLFQYLTSYTTAAGALTTQGDVSPLGPYLQAVPINPLAPAADNTAVDISLTGPVAVGSSSAAGFAWIYVPATGEFHGTNSVGTASDDGN